MPRETIQKKYYRVFSGNPPVEALPLLEAIASGEWTQQDARDLANYWNGVAAERERCAVLAENKMRKTSDSYLGDLAYEIRQGYATDESPTNFVSSESKL